MKVKLVRLKNTPLSIEKNRQDVWAKLERAPFPKVDLTVQKEIKYFVDKTSTYHRLQEYDLFFAYTKMFPLFDVRKIRDNRVYLPDIHERIFQQEKHKTVPALTSQIYGRPCRVQRDFPDKQHNRQAEIATLYRRFGVMPAIEREVQ